MTTSKTKPGMVLKQVECYATNTGEMAKELRTALINPATDELKDIQLKEAVTAIQAAYDQARETALECAGVEFEVNLPNNTTGLIVKTLLAALGIDLGSTIVPDSPVVG